MADRIDPQQTFSDFQRDGYVFIRRFLDQQEVDALLQEMDSFIRERLASLPREQVFFEVPGERSSLKQIQQLQAHDPYFEALFTGKFQALAEILLSGAVVGRNMQYFNKPPLIGKPTPPHQDGYYFMLEPCEALTMWLALDDVDEENGCVRYVRGSNHLGMRPHGRTQTLGFSQGMVDFGSDDDLANEVAFPAQPGDLLVHHALTIHRAEGNRSPQRQRQALGFIYYSQRAKEDLAAHAAYQQRLAEEMKAEGKI